MNEQAKYPHAILLTVKTNEVLIHGTARIILENIMLREIHKRSHMI
jgi:hypothetical protein